MTPATHGSTGRLLFKLPSLELPPGSVITIMGANGCGKSTLLRVLRAELSSASIDAASTEEHQWPIQELFLPQSVDTVVPPWLTPAAVVNLLRRARGWVYDIETFNSVVSIAQDNSLVDKRGSYLSGGERQLVSIGIALGCPSRTLLFDEPLSNLNPEWSSRVGEVFHKAVQSNRRTILLATHNLAFAMKFADAVLIINKCTKTSEMLWRNFVDTQHVATDDSLKEAVVAAVAQS